MTSVFLLPNGDGNVDNFLHEGSGSANLWQHIDDPVGAPNDADYIRGQASYQGPPLTRYIATLGDITLAANERVARMRIHFRIAALVAGVGKAIRYRWVIPNVVTSQMYLAQLSTTTFTDGTSPWIVPFATSDPTQAAMINKLRLEFQGAPFSGGSDGNARISQAYAEFDKRTRATVSGVAVTGAATTTRPTIDATYNDAVDNEDATRRQFKVFAQAVYEAAGFNPAASPAVWDSGVLLVQAAPGATITAMVGVDLVNGVTYKALVRAAKSFNGEPWWTEWASSAAFTINIVPPAAPSLTVTPEVDLAAKTPQLRNRLTISGGSINLLSADDANLEGGVGTWQSHANCGVAQSAAQANNGTQSLAMTSSAGGDMEAKAGVGTAGVPVVSGRQYTMLLSMRAATVARTILTRITWYDVAGTFISNDSVEWGPQDSTSAWTQYTMTRDAPANAAFAGPRVVVRATGGAGEVHYVDTISIHEGSSATWSAGGQSSDLIIVSRAVANDGVLNLVHPQVATGTDELRTTDGFSSTVASDSLISDERAATSGQRSLGWLIDTTTSRLTVGLPDGTVILDEATWAIPAIPGATMVCSLDCKANISTSLQLGLEAVNAAGTVLGTATKTITASTSFARESIQLAVHASAVWLRPYLLNTSGATGRLVNVDSVQVREGTDPDTQPWVYGQGRRLAWTVVRGGDAVHPAPADTPRVVFDEEAPPDRVVIYQAIVVRAPDGTNRISSIPTVPPATRLPLLTRTLLKDPLNPSLAMPVRVLAGPEQIVEDTETLRPLGRPDPITVSTTMTGRDRPLILVTEDAANQARLERLLQVRSALLLQWSMGGQRYVRLLSRELDQRVPGARPVLFVTADSVETGSPV